MSLVILKFILGPLENNTFLLYDDQSLEAAVVDPSFDPNPVVAACASQHLSLNKILLTHAHFDHIAGISYLFSTLPHPPQIYLHPDDRLLYQNGGGSSSFGIELGELPLDTTPLTHGQLIPIGAESIEIRHVPGHTRGHVLFYAPQNKTVLSGDLIFYRSIGRTDLPGGNFNQIIDSIQTQVLTLPRETSLLPGHGPFTSVGEEAEQNPYLG